MAGKASGQARAMTLAFTTFVLFQFFNIFNARAEHRSAFNRQFFANGKLYHRTAKELICVGRQRDRANANDSPVMKPTTDGTEN